MIRLQSQTRVLLIRHGQTTAGNHMFLGSRADPGLSAEGRRQARAAAQSLSPLQIRRVIVSPLRRARETAELLVPGRTLQIDDRLREIDYGVFSGLPIAEVDRLYPDELRAWQEGSIAPPGAEPVAQVAKRSIAAVLDAVEHLDSADVLLVTHNMPVRVLLTSARGRPLHEWRRTRAPHAWARIIRITPAVLERWLTLTDEAGVQGR